MYLTINPAWVTLTKTKLFNGIAFWVTETYRALATTRNGPKGDNYRRA